MASQIVSKNPHSHWFARFFSFFPTFLIIGFLGISLFFPQGNKFDSGKKISLTLGFAALAIFLFSFSFLKKWLLQKSQDSAILLEKGDNSLKRAVQPQQNYSAALAVTFFLGAYVVWTILSFFKSETANFGFTEVLMLCSCALLFVSERKIFQQKMLYVFINFMLVFSAVWGYVLYLNSHHERAFGLFYDPQFKTDAWPNAFALFVIMLWPLFFHCFWKGKKFQLLKIIGLGIIFASFVLSFSRAGFMVVVGQMGVLALYGIVCFLKNRKQTFPWKKILQLVMVVVLSILLIEGGQYARSHYFQKNTVSFADKATFANGEDVTSVQERLDFWKGGIKLTIQKPFFGYGPMSFGYTYRSIQNDWLAISDHPHNIFLKISAESGLPAALFFLLFLFLIFKKVFVNFKNFDGEKKFLLMILSVAFMGSLAHNLVDYNLNFATNFVIFWLLLIFIDELSKENQRTLSSPPSEKISLKKTESSLKKDSALVRAFHAPANSVRNDISLSKKPNFWLRLFSGTLLFVLFSGTLLLTGFQIYNEFSRISLVQKGVNDAQSYFSIYQHSLFSRYSLLEQGAWAAQNGNPQLAEQYYLLYVEKNRWDAFGFDRLGQFYEQQGNLEKALTNFSKTVELDPKNNWSYYLDELRMLERLNKKAEILAMSQKMKKELKQYVPKVKANLHYTAQTANAKDLLQILEILKRNDRENSSAFQQDEEIVSESIAKYNP